MFSVYVKFVKQKENCKEINKQQLSEKLCKFVLSLSLSVCLSGSCNQRSTNLAKGPKHENNKQATYHHGPHPHPATSTAFRLHLRAIGDQLFGRTLPPELRGRCGSPPQLAPESCRCEAGAGAWQYFNVYCENQLHAIIHIHTHTHTHTQHTHTKCN